MRVRLGGSHHQKFVVLRHPGRSELDVAFVGGIDLCHSRRDDAAHAGDPQRQPMARVPVRTRGGAQRRPCAQSLFRWLAPVRNPRRAGMGCRRSGAARFACAPRVSLVDCSGGVREVG